MAAQPVYATTLTEFPPRPGTLTIAKPPVLFPVVPRSRLPSSRQAATDLAPPRWSSIRRFEAAWIEKRTSPPIPESVAD
jgi:hypothetical protein